MRSTRSGNELSFQDKHLVSGDQINLARKEASLRNLIGSIVIALNPSDSKGLDEQINELIEFEKNLDIVS